MYDAPFAKGDLRVAFKTSGFDESKVSSCTKKSSQFFLCLAAAAHALQLALCEGSSFQVSDIAGFETLSGDDRRALQQPGPPPPSVLRAKAEAEAAAAARGDSPAHVGGPQLPPEVVAALPALVADRKKATSAKDLGADGGGELFLSADCAVQLVSRATKYVTKACGDTPQPQRQHATCHATCPPPCCLVAFGRARRQRCPMQDAEKSLLLWAAGGAAGAVAAGSAGDADGAPLRRPVLLLGASPVLRFRPALRFLPARRASLQSSADPQDVGCQTCLVFAGFAQEICKRNTKPLLEEKGVAIYRLVQLPAAGGSAEAAAPGAAAEPRPSKKVKTEIK